MKRIRIVQFGLGPIGLETLKLAASKPWIEVAGGIDMDPSKVGRSLGDLTGVPELKDAIVYSKLEDVLSDRPKPDMAFHTSVSQIAPACAQIEPLARRGISVISSCEELLFPQLRDPALATRLDEVCKAGGARVLGTGVNPGFVMDVLPICLTGVCRSVRGIHVQRVVNASTRRGPLQKKIGSGMTPEEFEGLFAQGKAGHAGLKDSAALIAHSLGWTLTELTETCRAIVANQDITTKHVQVRRGQCCGLHQLAQAKVQGRTVLTLDLKMYLDAVNPHDACQIDSDPPLHMRIEGGVAGDSATAAALVNAAPRVLQAPPGLLLMTDLAVPSVR